jgi:hypothetical protein
MLALLMVSETRLREAMISLSEASLRMTRRPVELDADGGPDCWRSSSDGMVSAGDGGQAGDNDPDGTWDGRGLEVRRGDHNARTPLESVAAGEDWVGDESEWSGAPDGPRMEGAPCEGWGAGVAGILAGGAPLAESGRPLKAMPGDGEAAGREGGL